MADLKNITVNGVPLEKVIDEEARAEYRSHHDKEVSNMAFLVSRSKSKSSRFRCGSHARSGKGRVIFSAALTPRLAGGVA